MSVWPRVLILLLLACAYAHEWPAVPMMQPGMPSSGGIAPDFSDPADDIPKSRKEALAMVRQYVPGDEPPENYNLVPPSKPGPGQDRMGQDGPPTPKPEEEKEKIKPPKKMPENYGNRNINMFHNFERYLARNDNQPEPKMPKMPPVPDVPPPQSMPFAYEASSDGKDPRFESNTFALRGRRRMKAKNLTHCIDLTPSKPFEPAMIVDIRWVPFYDFTIAIEAVTYVVYLITYVPARVVKEYYEMYKNHVSDAVNWDQPKLLLKEVGPTDTFSKEYLLIAINRRGHFHMLHKYEMPEGLKRSHSLILLPTVLLKIEDPYLLLALCEFDWMLLMAHEDYVPATKQEKEAEAKTIGIKRKGATVRTDTQLAQELSDKDMREKARKQKEKEARKYLPANHEYGLWGSEDETLAPRKVG